MKYSTYFFYLLVFLSLKNVAIAQNIPRADSVKSLLNEAKNNEEKFELYLRLASYSLPLEGLSYANEALSIAKEYHLDSSQALAYELISICQRKFGNNAQAIKASLEALKIYDDLGLVEKTASMQLQIGAHFTNDKNFPEAIEYITKALGTFRVRNDSINIAFSLINLGETYRLMENLDSSAACFTECLSLNESLKNELVQGYATGNLGMVHKQQLKLPEAKAELKTSIDILSRLGDLYSVSVYQAELAKIFIEEGNKNLGEQLLLSSLDMAKKEALKEQIRDVSNDLANMYENQKEFKKALYYRKQYEMYHDSLVNIDNVRKIEQLHSQYWLEQKEANITYLEKESSNRLKLISVLAAGAALLLTLSVFLYHTQRQRKKAFTKVSEQNILIEKRDQEKALLLRELNHRVKNNLQMVASLFNLQAGQFKGQEAEEGLKAARMRIETLLLVHQKLYKEDTDTLIRMDEYIKELANNLILSFGLKASIKQNLMPYSLHIDSAIPLALIINELITNSLKYALVKGQNLELDISLHQQNGLLLLAIADNGPGLPIDPEKQRSGSMGLKLVYSLIKQLKGEIKQTNDKGCHWNITLDTNKLQKSNHG